MNAVIRFSALGDIASALPFLRALHERPAVITTPIGAQLLVDEFPDQRVLASKSLGDVWRLIRQLRQDRFAHVVDLQNNDRSRLIRTVCGAGAVISSQGMPGGVPNLENFRRILEPTGLMGPLDESFLPKPRDYIVLNTGSSQKWESKRLPLEKWEQFAKVLLERFDLPFKLTGSPDEAEYVGHVARHLPGSWEVVAGKTSLVELKRLLGNAFLVVSTDSAAMHLAAAEHTPTIGLFGATNWVRSRPYGPWSTVLFDRSVYSEGKPPAPNRTECGRYYDNIHLLPGLDRLRPYLEL